LGNCLQLNTPISKHVCGKRLCRFIASIALATKQIGAAGQSVTLAAEAKIVGNFYYSFTKTFEDRSGVLLFSTSYIGKSCKHRFISSDKRPVCNVHAVLTVFGGCGGDNSCACIF